MNETMKLLTGEQGEGMQMIAANALAFHFNLEGVKAARIRLAKGGVTKDAPPLMDEREPTPQERDDALEQALKLASAAFYIHQHACDNNADAYELNKWRKCATWQDLAPKPDSFRRVFEQTAQMMKLCGGSADECFAAATKAAEAAAERALEEWKGISLELSGFSFPYEGDIEDAAADLESACHSWMVDCVNLTADAVRRERARALARLQAGKYANPDPEPLLWLKAHTA